MLNDIAAVLNSSIKENEQLRHKNGIVNDSKIAVVLSHVIDYCMMCIIKRMNELNSHKNKIYLEYETQKNDFKKLIHFSIQQQPLRPK